VGVGIRAAADRAAPGRADVRQAQRPHAAQLRADKVQHLSHGRRGQSHALSPVYRISDSLATKQTGGPHEK
jgi:hypothetical protein